MDSLSTWMSSTGDLQPSDGPQLAPTCSVKISCDNPSQTNWSLLVIPS